MIILLCRPISEYADSIAPAIVELSKSFPQLLLTFQRHTPMESILHMINTKKDISFFKPSVFLASLLSDFDMKKFEVNKIITA